MKGYDGRACLGPANCKEMPPASLPFPKYDVERRGKYSAGSLRFPKKAKTATRKKPKPPATVIWDDPAAMEPEE